MYTGVLYILVNQSFPEFVKLGYAENITTHLNQLNALHITPYKFEVFTTFKISKVEAERILSQLDENISVDAYPVVETGFYQMTAKEAEMGISYLLNPAAIFRKFNSTDSSDTSEHRSAAFLDSESKQRRPRFKFSCVGMKNGDVIEYIPDPSIKVMVYDESHVLYKRKKYKLSTLARKLSRSSGNLQGTRFFGINGETLDDMRKRFEENPSLLEEKLKEKARTVRSSHDMVDMKTGQRPPFRFSMVGLRPGDVVYFVEDKTKAVLVADDRHVRYRGVTYSLSRLAQIFKNTDKSLQGPIYFEVDGITLEELRRRRELAGGM